MAARWIGIAHDDHDLKDQMLSKINEIRAVLRERTRDTELPPGLMDGHTGIAIFFLTASRMLDCEEDASLAVNILSKAFDLANAGMIPPTFASGLAGIGWAMQYAVQESLLESDVNNMLGGLDQFAEMMIDHYMSSGFYDYLHGGLGSAMYLQSRLSHKDTSPILARFVDMLDAHAIRFGENGMTWRDRFSPGWESTQRYNLGLAHGLPSVVAVLAKLHSKEISPSKCRSLAEGTTRFILNQELKSVSMVSMFPPWINTGEMPGPSRLAWCYGDLGIAGALMRASQLFGANGWRESAIRIAEYSLRSRDFYHATVDDPGICHGVAGIAHIYNRLFQATEDQSFLEAALFWYRRLLQISCHVDGFAGFKVPERNNPGYSLRDMGFLEGIAGIGLVLLAALGTSEPTWDECLLLS